MEEYETGLKSNCIPIAIVDGKNNGVGLLPTAVRNIPGLVFKVILLSEGCTPLYRVHKITIVPIFTIFLHDVSLGFYCSNKKIY